MADAVHAADADADADADGGAADGDGDGPPKPPELRQGDAAYGRAGRLWRRQGLCPGIWPSSAPSHGRPPLKVLVVP